VRLDARVADVTMSGPLLDTVGRVCCLIADKGYHANMLRRCLKAEGAEVVFPGRSNGKLKIDYDEAATRAAGASRLPSAG
jgi:hypothetical protein